MVLLKTDMIEAIRDVALAYTARERRRLKVTSPRCSFCDRAFTNVDACEQHETLCVVRQHERRIP